MLSRRPLIVLLIAASAASAASVAAAGGWSAVGDTRRPATEPAAAATVDDSAAFEQPPLPAARAKVVEPVAGRASSAPADAAAPVVDDEGADRAPTRAASTSRVRRSTPATAIEDALHDATALPNGIALPPLEAPAAVMTIIQAGNSIARSPYKWGGGHGRWVDTGYDCSGSVSYALAAAGLLGGPLDSSRLMGWGRAGKGKWVTVYSSVGHVYMEVAGLRFDTSGARVTGSRWQSELRSGGGFVARHPPGL
jgi:cell wall-associated NlpC family hydrolase